MKVVALGGAGGMGRVAARTAATLDVTSVLVVADLDGEAAERLAAECGPGASALPVDVTDEAALRRLLGETDVVLNTTGPFYRFGVPILRAAIDARCHYLDINDDWEPTLEMLALDSEARSAGVTAIVGLGASPGISNLLAVSAMRDLDEVTDLVTRRDLRSPEAARPRRDRVMARYARVNPWLRTNDLGCRNARGRGPCRLKLDHRGRNDVP